MPKKSSDSINDANNGKNMPETVKLPVKPKASRIMQINVPTCSVTEALLIAKALWENYAGKPTTPINVCKALDISPNSSKWRDLAGASIAYGFTNGGSFAKVISLEPLGKRAVASTEEGDDIRAMREAVNKPTILNRFFTYYQGKRLPKDSIAENMLVDLDCPKDRAAGVLQLIKENGTAAHLFTETKGGTYVHDHDMFNMPEEGDIPTVMQGQDVLGNIGFDRTIKNEEVVNQRGDEKRVGNTETNNRVFISHGKNRTIVENLKTILSFGKFDPIVSVERESTAISVPEKVFTDMRACCAGIIHIEEEQTLLDDAGNKHTVINENVLIEIGAAIALYKTNVILLCQKGMALPSNLQGLYRCEYEGNKLDVDATMKLLQTINSFRNGK